MVADGVVAAGLCIRETKRASALPAQIAPALIKLKISAPFWCREVVQRRVYTVTGEVPGEAQVEDLIERGESEQVFQRAIKSGGRLEVMFHPQFFCVHITSCWDCRVRCVRPCVALCTARCTGDR